MAKSRSELEAMTKDELVAYADDRDIEVHHSWLKDDIITSILNGEKGSTRSVAQSDTQSQSQSAEQKGKQHPKVDPELAENQKLAQKLPNESTRFAPKPPEGK